MSFDLVQFKNLIERVLKKLEMHSHSAVNLLLGTAAQESAFGTYIRQIGGPARGVFQVEPETEFDCWQNFIRFRYDLKLRLYRVAGVDGPDPEAMEYNLAYAIAMARIIYWRVPAPLPDENDIYATALYWKTHYNTAMGRGSVDNFIRSYNRYVKGAK